MFDLWARRCAPRDLHLGQCPQCRTGGRGGPARGLCTIGLTGRHGGTLKAAVDICINVPADETYLIQEYHLPVYHYLCQAIEATLFPESGSAGSYS
jgi:hypothetical protein